MNAEIREVLGKVVYLALADGGDRAEWERLEDEQEKERCRCVADDVVRVLVAFLAPVARQFLPPEEIAELSKDTDNVRTDTPTRQGQPS